MRNYEKFPIGWTDTTCPGGIGYRIMTEIGMKVYDEDERSEFEAEKRRVAQFIKSRKENQKDAVE